MSGIVSKVLKMLVFPSFFGFFLGWLIVVHLGLEGLGVFVFLVFVFVCFVLLLFLSCLLCSWFCGWMFLFCFFCLFVFFWLFCFFCFVFFGGFKGHVRWPEGPPHLALNPPYFICFVFLFLFFFVFLFVFFVSLLFFFLEGLRVRWGGPKGHLTWP